LIEKVFGRLRDSILARVLKKLTAEGLLIRDEKLGDFPPKVYYSLAPQVRNP
jgi:DNA-binding HxlR family transcriptional regulator